jgi:hypothetical protein
MLVSFLFIDAASLLAGSPLFEFSDMAPNRETLNTVMTNYHDRVSCAGLPYPVRGIGGFRVLVMRTGVVETTL